MEDQVKQDSLNIIVSDTIVKVSDTLNLNLTNAIKLFQGDELLVVKTIPEPVSGIEFWGLLFGIIAAIVTVVYTFIALRKLLSNDEQLQSQINELVKLNKLVEKRLRMVVKPRLIINGTGVMGKEKTFTIHVHNRGEIAYYTGYEMLEGGVNVLINEWDTDVPIEKNQQIILGGHFTDTPANLSFKFKIKYYDAEKYFYESIIEWKKGQKSIIETIEK